MKILVTAGSTQVPIDKVRAITNIFHGRTGTEIARYFFDATTKKEGEDPEFCHEVTLITSSPNLFLGAEGLDEVEGAPGTYRCILGRKVRVLKFKTFDDLAALMEKEIRTGGYDVVIHSAAVSDYEVAGVFERGADERLAEVDSSAKISSKYPELFLRMVPTFKIVDKIRREWGFKGKLVKFKLEVGKTDEELIEIAKRSCAASDTDLIVANCLEWARERAYIIDRNCRVENVTRDLLAEKLGKLLGCEEKGGGYEGTGRQFDGD